MALELRVVALLLLCFRVSALTDQADVEVLQNFLKSVKNGAALGWSGDDPCGNKWARIRCEGSSVTAIFAADLQLQGTLPPDLNKMANLQSLQLQNNAFTGSLPSLKGLASLTEAFLVGNSFDTIPGDFFSGLTALQHIYLDGSPLNGPKGWSLPSDVQGSTQLLTLSLTNTTLVGMIPDFLGKMPSLRTVNMAYNRLGGGIPATFGSSNLIQLQLNNQQGPVLGGPITVVGKMQSLKQLWLQVNQFTGTIPESLISAVSLEDLRLNDNQLVGIIPADFVNLPLGNFTVENNQLSGAIPTLPSTVRFVYSGNVFCQPSPGMACAPEVTALLDFLAGVSFPSSLAASWKGNDPCSGWMGVICDSSSKKVAVLQLTGYQLNGTIAPSLSNLTGLTTLQLKDNHLSGVIPAQLAALSALKIVDLRNNNLSKPVPSFPSQVQLDISGNPLGDAPPAAASAPGSTPHSSPSGSGDGGGRGGDASLSGTPTSGSAHRSSSKVGAIVGAVLGAVVVLLLAAVAFALLRRRKRSSFLRVQSPNTVVVHPRDSGSDPEVVKIVVAGSSNGSASQEQNGGSSEPTEVQVVEAGNLLISIQVLRHATNNFSEQNILGSGGFGVVYRGALHDGTNIAVKRMEAAALSSKGLKEFQSEIAVLSKVRHRHLVALLGYCTEGNERMLVYEYMPQGALSQHLLQYGKLEMMPLSWKQRLSVALDVARGMEYLHSWAQQSFIHRDLKPSNILLGDDFHAKVSDFGLVKLASEGKHSMETRLAGTFGYLAPEYAATGRVTTKVDVFSFGVVLMELITGRRALDETQPDENMHLVAWFRKMNASKETFKQIIDPSIEDTDDTFLSISTTAELAGHCTAREPYQRPDMGHAVNVLAPLVELWKPADCELEETAGIDFDMTLPQALKRWQALENPSMSNLNDTQASIATLPSGFTDSFTSTDCR